MTTYHLRGTDGTEVFTGTIQPPPGGGSNPGGLAIYGDGSDGDITLASDTYNWPDASGIPVWTAGTAYALGDQIVGNAGSPQRIYECVSAGTSGDTIPNGFDDTYPPGENRRGDRYKDNADEDLSLGVIWEQVTAICEGVLEGPLFCDHFDANGHSLISPGWPIYAHSTATIPAGSVISAKGSSAVGATGGVVSVAPITFFGNGVAGVDGGVGAGTSGLAGGPIWGGGIGGNGGAGDGGVGGHTDPIVGFDAPGFTLGRRTIFTIWMMWLLQGVESGSTIGSSGGAGAGDGDAKSGGGSGAAGSALVIMARNLVLNGSLDCSGGNGGDGEAGGNTGGGGGGSGGCCVLVYDAKTGTGTVSVAGGAGGSGQGTGSDGTAGSGGDFVEIANA